MQNPETLLKYAQKAVSELIVAGTFPGGQPFRISQEEALYAYERILFNNALSTAEKLRRFFEMPTGVGKTAVFAGLIGKMTEIAASDNIYLKSMVVVPTVRLMYQIKDEIISFAPNLNKRIGLYGDTRKDMTKPTTVITYDSWVALIERGELSAEDVDILISDEAHQGTSERRVDHMWDYFSDGVLSLGFTATARYDEEKTIKLTHGEAAYERGIADAVVDGELAAYIQTMLYIIRVLPPTAEQEFNAKTKGIPQFRSDLKKTAWSQRIVAIARDGVDPQTGDPLSDNQFGVYCAGTTHIDYTVSLLNADPVLNEKARSMGMRGVAVPIHSALPAARSANRRNWGEYTGGEWLMQVSDDMLKEGMNHPPMKNLMDYHHFSLLLKAQILGRAGRQWLNDSRMRFEGANIIDTVTYIGDPNPKRNQAIRDSALRDAILAWDVIGGTHVFSRTYARKMAEKKPIRKPTDFLQTVAIVGQEVEAYIDMEGLESIKAHRDKLTLDAKSYIEFTPEMREVIVEQVDRTGVSCDRLPRLNKTQWPNDLLPATVRSWYFGRMPQKARKDHWSFVLATYRALPNKPNKISRVIITDEVRKRLQEEQNRTGINVNVLLRLHSDDMPEGLQASILSSWLSGAIKTARQDYLDWTLDKWSKVPDNLMVPLTEEMKQRLQYHRRRTGVTLRELMEIYPDHPESITPHTYNTIMRDDSTIIREEEFAWLEDRWAKLPNKTPKVELIKESLSTSRNPKLIPGGG